MSKMMDAFGAGAKTGIALGDQYNKSGRYADLREKHADDMEKSNMQKKIASDLFGGGGIPTPEQPVQQTQPAQPVGQATVIAPDQPLGQDTALPPAEPTSAFGVPDPVGQDTVLSPEHSPPRSPLTEELQAASIRSESERMKLNNDSPDRIAVVAEGEIADAPDVTTQGNMFNNIFGVGVARSDTEMMTNMVRFSAFDKRYGTDMANIYKDFNANNLSSLAGMLENLHDMNPDDQQALLNRVGPAAFGNQRGNLKVMPGGDGNVVGVTSDGTPISMSPSEMANMLKSRANTLFKTKFTMGKEEAFDAEQDMGSLLQTQAMGVDGTPLTDKQGKPIYKRTYTTAVELAVKHQYERLRTVGMPKHKATAAALALGNTKKLGYERDEATGLYRLIDGNAPATGENGASAASNMEFSKRDIQRMFGDRTIITTDSVGQVSGSAGETDSGEDVAEGAIPEGQSGFSLHDRIQDAKNISPEATGTKNIEESAKIAEARVKEVISSPETQEGLKAIKGIPSGELSNYTHLLRQWGRNPTKDKELTPWKEAFEKKYPGVVGRSAKELRGLWTARDNLGGKTGIPGDVDTFLNTFNKGMYGIESTSDEDTQASGSPEAQKASPDNPLVNKSVPLSKMLVGDYLEKHVPALRAGSAGTTDMGDGKYSTAVGAYQMLEQHWQKAVDDKVITKEDKMGIATQNKVLMNMFPKNLLKQILDGTVDETKLTEYIIGTWDGFNYNAEGIEPAKVKQRKLIAKKFIKTLLDIA